MIHERNYSITLDEQIALIRADIDAKKSLFPIDIIDNVEDDNQLYYERADGYTEKYVYDGDGSCISYWDSNMEVKPVNDLEDDTTDLNFVDELKLYFENNPREKVLEDWEKSEDFDKVVGPTVEEVNKRMIIDKPSEGMGNGGTTQLIVNLYRRISEMEALLETKSNEEFAKKPKEQLVYLVDVNNVDIDNHLEYDVCAQAFFKAEAIRQGLVMTPYQFSERNNTSQINMKYKLIRFI